MEKPGLFGALESDTLMRRVLPEFLRHMRSGAVPKRWMQRELLTMKS